VGKKKVKGGETRKKSVVKRKEKRTKGLNPPTGNVEWVRRGNGTIWLWSIRGWGGESKMIFD